MKLGLFTVLYNDKSLDDVIEIASELGLGALEIGVANFPETAQLEGLTSDQAIDRLVNELDRRGLSISALSCQGNPLHPQERVAGPHQQGWRKTLEWARRLNVRCVNVFSGCPGGPGESHYPNWVTTAWPNEYRELLEWQWQKKVVPYWQTEAAVAARYGVTQIAMEMHPGFVVYNPRTCLKLREAVGPIIGANLDPSHLFWQGINPLEAAKTLLKAEALFHVHAKDVSLDAGEIAVNGVLDTRDYRDLPSRSWSFCTVGYGHGPDIWGPFVQTLRRYGYDGVLSIEHEDALASRDEGIRHAVQFLRPLVWTEQPEAMWWA